MFLELNMFMHQSMSSPRVGGPGIPRGIWHFCLSWCQMPCPGAKLWCQNPPACGRSLVLCNVVWLKIIEIHLLHVLVYYLFHVTNLISQWVSPLHEILCNAERALPVIVICWDFKANTVLMVPGFAVVTFNPREHIQIHWWFISQACHA